MGVGVLDVGVEVALERVVRLQLLADQLSLDVLGLAVAVEEEVETLPGTDLTSRHACLLGGNIP